MALHTDSPELVDYRQDLDLRRGVLSRRMRFVDSSGRALTVSSERLVSKHTRHLAAIHTTFEAENWSGPVRVRFRPGCERGQRQCSGLAQLADRHLRTVRTDVVDAETVRLEAITSRSADHGGHGGENQVLSRRCRDQPGNESAAPA